MRTAIALLLFVAGSATTGAAIVRRGERIRPASPWSISQRLAALRIDRALPLSAQLQASLSFEGPAAFLRVHGQGGSTLIRCPKSADLAKALFENAEGRSPAGCETQSLEDSGDVLVYEASRRVPALCPGSASTLSEEQLERALFLPALVLQQTPGAPSRAILQSGGLELCGEGKANCALFRAAGSMLYCGVVRTCAEGACFQGAREIKPDDVAASLYFAQAVAHQGTALLAPPVCGPLSARARAHAMLGEAVTATTAQSFALSQAPLAEAPAQPTPARASIEGFFAQHPRGICFAVDGVDLERPRDTAAVWSALAFPVFAPEDPRAAGRSTPLFRGLQAAARDPDALAALFPGCELAGEPACREKRARISAQLRSALGTLQPALESLSEAELPLHIGASGPFHLAERDAQHLMLESSALFSRAGKPSPLRIRYQPLWPELFDERRTACAKEARTCLFRAPWSADARGSTSDAGSLVGLFSRANAADASCVRKLFNAVVAADPHLLAELQRELHPAEKGGGQPCDPRARGAMGLLPRDRPAACEKVAPQPFGDTAEVSCAPLHLVYADEEPWAKAASTLSAIAARAGVPLTVSSASLSEIHRAGFGELRGEASDAESPSDARDESAADARDSSWDLALTVAAHDFDARAPSLAALLEPQLEIARRAGDPQGAQLLAAYEASALELAPDREKRLRRLEELVARRGPAPIYPLAFLPSQTTTIPPSQTLAARDRWYLAELPEAWSANR